MDALLEAVAEVISQTEREAAAARTEGAREATLTEVDTSLTGAA